MSFYLRIDTPLTIIRFVDLLETAKNTKNIALAAPHVRFAIHTKVQEKLRNIIEGMDTVNRVSTGKGAFIYESPWDEKLQENLKRNRIDVNVDAFRTSTHTNIRGYRGFSLMIRVISIFLKYQREDIEGPFHKSTIAMSFINAYDSKAKMSDDNASVLTTYYVNEERSNWFFLSVKDFVNGLGLAHYWSNLMIFRSQKKRTTIDGFGTIDTIPSGSKGLCFPYFEGLIISDRFTVMSTFTRLFFRGLGQDEASALKRLDAITEGWKHIYDLPIGRAITHLVEGIDLAIQCGSRLHVIVDNGSYEGFVILGDSFKIYQRGVVYEPMEPDAFLADCQIMSKHRAALGKIATILSQANTITGDVTVVDKDSLVSSRILFQRCFERVFDDAAKGLLKDLIIDVHFDENFAPPTHDNLISFITASSELRIIQDGPLILDGWTLFSSDPILLNAARFGNRAPSIRDSLRGHTRVIIPPSSARDSTLDSVGGKVQYEKVPVNLVGYRTASSDFASFLKDSTVIFARGPTGGYPRANQVFEGNNRDQIVAALRKAVDLELERKASLDKKKDKGKKRVVESDDDMETEQSVKKVKASDEIEDLFDDMMF